MTIYKFKCVNPHNHTWVEINVYDGNMDNTYISTYETLE